MGFYSSNCFWNGTGGPSINKPLYRDMMAAEAYPWNLPDWDKPCLKKPMIDLNNLTFYSWSSGRILPCPRTNFPRRLGKKNVKRNSWETGLGYTKCLQTFWRSFSFSFLSRTQCIPLWPSCSVSMHTCPLLSTNIKPDIDLTFSLMEFPWRHWFSGTIVYIIILNVLQGHTGYFSLSWDH